MNLNLPPLASPDHLLFKGVVILGRSPEKLAAACHLVATDTVLSDDRAEAVQDLVQGEVDYSFETV